MTQLSKALTAALGSATADPLAVVTAVPTETPEVTI